MEANPAADAASIRAVFDMKLTEKERLRLLASLSSQSSDLLYHACLDGWDILVRGVRGLLHWRFNAEGVLWYAVICCLIILGVSCRFEEFPGSDTNFIVGGIADADGVVLVEVSPVNDGFAGSPRAGRVYSPYEGVLGADLGLGAYDRMVAEDRDPLVRPRFLTTEEMWQRDLGDLQVSPMRGRFHAHQDAEAVLQAGAMVSRFGHETPPSEPVRLTRMELGRLGMRRKASDGDGFWVDPNTLDDYALEHFRYTQHEDDGTKRREATFRRRASRKIAKLHTPLALYHTRLHMYGLYTAAREVRAEQLRRLQYFWAEEVMRPAELTGRKPNALTDEDRARRDFRRAHLEAELRQTRFAAYVQRTYMRALRHADAMRMESLHYLRLMGLTIPALSEAWKGDDYCGWLGVTCHTVHIPLYKLLDEHHGYLQAYSRDVFGRLPRTKQLDVVARFDALLELGDKINVNGRVRDEASGFAQRMRDLMMNQAIAHANNGRSRYANENGDNMRASGGPGTTAKEAEAIKAAAAALEREKRESNGVDEEDEDEEDGELYWLYWKRMMTDSPPSSSPTQTPTPSPDDTTQPRRHVASAEDLTEEERAHAREGAVALWYMLDDNATGIGQPSDTWTKAVWFEYHSGDVGRGDFKDTCQEGGMPRTSLSGLVLAHVTRGLLGTKWLYEKHSAVHGDPFRLLATVRGNAFAWQTLAREYEFPFMNRRVACSLAAPRVYYGSIEGDVSEAYYASGRRTSNGQRASSGKLLSPFIVPSSAPTNSSRHGPVLEYPPSTDHPQAGGGGWSAMKPPGEYAAPPPITAAMMDSTLREVYEVFSETELSQAAGTGRRRDVDTVPVTVFSLNLRDLGLTGVLPRRIDTRGDLEDCDGWSDGTDCHGNLFTKGELAMGMLRMSYREKPKRTLWQDPSTQLPHPFFPSPHLRKLVVEDHFDHDDLFPYIEEDANTSLFDPIWLDEWRKGVFEETEEYKKLVRQCLRTSGDCATGVRETLPERLHAEARVLRLFLQNAAAEHGVQLDWPHVLQGEQARRRWLSEERALDLLRLFKRKARYIIGPRAPTYFGVERPLDDLLSERATQPGRGYTSATATDVGALLRRSLLRLEFFGAHTRHHDLAEYFGPIAVLGHFRGESTHPLFPFSPLSNYRMRALLGEWGLDLKDTIEDGFVYASRLVKTLRHVDDDVVTGHLRPDLVPLVELDVSRNPALYGRVPPHYFRFPLLRYLHVTSTNIFFRIADSGWRDQAAQRASRDVPSPRYPSRKAVPFHTQMGSYVLDPVMNSVSVNFFDFSAKVISSHLPRQDGSWPWGISRKAGVNASEACRLDITCFARPTTPLSRKRILENPPVFTFATSNWDQRLTNTRSAVLGEGSTRDVVAARLREVCSRPALGYLLGGSAPLS